MQLIASDLLAKPWAHGIIYYLASFLGSTGVRRRGTGLCVPEGGKMSMNRRWVSWSLLLLAVTTFAAAPEPAVKKSKTAQAKTAAAKSKPAKTSVKKASVKKASTKTAAKKLPAKKAPVKKPEPKRTLSKSGAAAYELAAPATPANQIDRIVFAKLKTMNIQPKLCSDAVFVRRAYLDITGTIPTAWQAKNFIENPNTKTKRIALVDHLMKQDAFATYWSMKWSDILRIKAEFPINLWPNAAQAYHRWVMASISENKPYDQFVREMLTSSGSNFRVGPVNFYRAIQNKTPEGIATAVALTFMGARAESWSEEQFAGMVTLFSQVGYKPTNEWKEENVFWDPLKLSTNAGAPGVAKPTTIVAPPSNAVPTEVTALPATVTMPNGAKLKVPANKDPREVFADWLITPENPWFTRSIANRVWAWLLGRGIIHLPDDIRKDNPASMPALLAYLEKELKGSDYDLKHIYRLILTSNTYQLSSIAPRKSPDAEANFASYPLRRLDAEVLIDVVNKITGTTDLYTSPIPEPFTYIPKDMPAVAIADGSITSRFLALFGRSARATGMSDEKNLDPVSSQWLHMLNSGHIQNKILNGWKLKEVYKSKASMGAKMETLYLTFLSRYPTAEELEVVRNYNKVGVYKSWTDWQDVAWGLMNSPEFLYRH